MPQGSRPPWKFDICIEFDCNEEYAANGCGGDFTKPPCLFLGEHKELNLAPEYEDDMREPPEGSMAPDDSHLYDETYIENVKQ